MLFRSPHRAERARTFRTKGVHDDLVEALNASQEAVPGFSLAAYQGAHILIIGAGALGAWAAEGMLRKGGGEMSQCDFDVVELKNCTRQPFSERDLGRNKAFVNGRRLARQGLFPATIHAHPYSFRELITRGFDFSTISACLCLPDNDATRTDAARLGVKHGKPVITAGLSLDARSLYVAVQEPGKACLRCLRPHMSEDGQARCGIPGSIDCVFVAVGLVLIALDGVLAGAFRAWNLRTLYLDGSRPDHCTLIERDPGCELCGSSTKARERDDA